MRLIIDTYHMGEWNMSCDMAISNYVHSKHKEPTIRIYGWTIPTLSLGKHQKLKNIDLEYLKEAGIDLVRRPTGGRAVLHNKEITYSFCCSENYPKLPSNVVKSYMKISEGLTKALNFLGVECDFEKIKKENLSKDICYDTPSIYEITVGGKKLIGSAQYRNGKTVLQHGSIPQIFDYDNYVNCFKINNKEKMIEHLKKNVIDVFSLKNKFIEFEELAYAFKIGFKEVFEEDIIIEGFSNTELKMTKEILESRK